MTSKQTVSIATHSGSFHTDDVFAVATLLVYLEKTAPEKGVEIIRTRDEDVYSKADYVVDVGGEHDPEKRRFDHHQEEGAGERENGIPYAAFGLVWQAYGEEVAGADAVAEVVDARLVQAIDGPDNGVSLTGEAKFDGVFPYFLGDAVNVFKPTWRESDEQADATFEELVEMAKILLGREIAVATDRIEGGKLVEEAYERAEDKRLVILDKNLPYRYTLLQHPEPLFVVYPKESGRWRLRAVVGENFNARKKLPKSWRGKRGEELTEVTGVESAVFCHNSLPMITANEKADIIELAERALEWHGEGTEE